MARDFADLYDRTQASLNDGSAANPITVKASSRSRGGFESRITLRDHTITSDQPYGFEGTNKGPKPSELLLAALAACQEMTWRLYADAMGIPLDEITIELRGLQDLRGFLGTSDSVPAGFLHIEGDVTVQSTAPDQDLERLRAAVDAHCPVLDDLVRSVPVSLSLKRADPA